ncbi:MAG: CCA tRNA nucleotidyltransferase [Planctomycetota bacterium]|jgi:poly(A) polymerase
MVRRPEDSNYRNAERIVLGLRRNGHVALLAGGCVRDLLRGVEPGDYDIATSARPEQVQGLFARTRGVGSRFGVCLVLMDARAYEVATFRRESGYSDGRHPDSVTFCGPEADARRRDFTINGMFWDPVEDEVLAFVGGRADLERRLIRAIGNPEERFREDHLRLLRAVRFAARFGFRLEERTRAALSSLAHLAAQVSAERLQEELRIILSDPEPAAALRLMDELGMLCVVFPELKETRGCEQPENYHPEGDVFVHTLLTVEQLGPHPDFVLALAALLHDVGKPEASRQAGPKHFPEHARIGRDMAEKVCRRLRLSNDEIERVCWLVERHLYFRDARGMRQSTLKRLFAEPGFGQLAELHRADALASWGNLDAYNYVIETRRGMAHEEVEPPRLITGHDLMEMGYEPGPLLGRVLEAVRDAQLEGEVRTPEQARALARGLAEAERGEES